MPARCTFPEDGQQRISPARPHSAPRERVSRTGLRPGAKHGPRHFIWFKTVVAGYFLQKRDRELVVQPRDPGAWEKGTNAGLSRADFDSITDAIEIGDRTGVEMDLEAEWLSSPTTA